MEGKRRGDSFIETNPRRKNVEGQEKRHRGRIAVRWKIETRGRELREKLRENGGAPLTTGGENSREERTPVLL